MPRARATSASTRSRPPTGASPTAEGRIDALPSTVDVAEATYTNTVGAQPSSERFWRDPDFDPAERAFYYPRAIEIATPRWSTYDAKRLGVAPPEPHSLQERAVGSSIWVEPAR